MKNTDCHVLGSGCPGGSCFRITEFRSLFRACPVGSDPCMAVSEAGSSSGGKMVGHEHLLCYWDWGSQGPLSEFI